MLKTPVRMSHSVLNHSLDFTRAEDSPMQIDFVSPKNHKNKRKLIVEELLETEENYIQILEALVNEIQTEMEKSKLLDVGQIKIIFGKLPEILKIHLQLYTEIKNLMFNWKDSTAIGQLSNIFNEYSSKLLEKYSPYVNTMESSKEMISECKKDERFFALLKKCESKPECKRATLNDMLSRPFQRLFHVRNLLQRLLDDIKEESSDLTKLSSALNKLDQTLSLINENKRKTETHLAAFADFNKIKDLPLELISSNNRINGQVNARKLRLIENKLIPCNSINITLFLFNDALVVRSLFDSFSIQIYFTLNFCLCLGLQEEVS